MTSLDYGGFQPPGQLQQPGVKRKPQLGQPMPGV